MAEKKVAGEAFMGFVTSGVDALGQGLANESVYDAGVVMYQWFAAQAASETFISLVGPLLGGVAAEPGKVIAKNIANGLNKAATAIDIGRIGWSFKEAWKYWDEPPETVRWCIEDKALYGGCSETIEITPDSVQLAMGTSMPLVATVLDGQDRYLEGRKVAWTSGDLAVARFQGDHAHTIAALVSEAGTPGKAVITASTPNGAIGKARVYVADPTVLIALDYVHPDQWVPTARQYHAADTIPVINGIHFPHLRQPGDGSTAQFGNWDNNYPRQLADTIVEAFGMYTLHVSNESHRMLHGRVLRTHHISNPDSWQTRTFISVDHFNYVTNNPGDPDGPTDNGAFPYEWLHGPSWQILRCADGSTRAVHGVVGRIYFGGVTVLLLEDGSVRFADDRAGVCPDAEPHGVVLSG